MNQVVTRLKILISEKEFRENRKLTYDVIYSETGIAGSTLVEWANNRVKRYDEKIVAKLCDYFNCDIGDLLVLHKN